jgi:hypothetical protein
MPKKKSPPLIQKWVHSHEEDTPEETVFRPENYAFPRSRGRQALTFHADGTFTETGPGPNDAPVEKRGSWESSTENRIALLAPGAKQKRHLEIVSVAPDRLVLKKETGNDSP